MIGLVILAAGGSTRLGQPKQLLRYGTTTLLQHTINTALALEEVPIVVVLGAHAAEIHPQLDASPRVLLVENLDWAQGLGGSLRTGLRALLTAHVDLAAALFLLCDQPHVSAAMLQNLIATHERTGASIVAAQYQDALGVPALFARPFFPELLAWRGDSGAQQVIRAHRDSAVGVSFPEGAIDIDTRADYAHLRRVTG